MMPFLIIFNRLIFRHVITGNTNGDIFFYDKSLRVQYHLNLFVGDPITSISMLDNQIPVENGWY